MCFFVIIFVMVDLHTHSTCSDGTYTPHQLIDEACSLGLKAIALTDHDTLKGIKIAKEYAKGRIIFVAGVEVSIEWKNGECHLLGLGVKEDADELNNLLTSLEKEREKRACFMAKQLCDAGFDIDYDEIAKNAEGTVGRPHFASYMKEHNMVKTVQEAFDKYFGIGKPFYVEKKNADIKDAIQAIKKADGVPVLAHPMSLYRSWKQIPSIIEEFKELGLKGLEAWHPGTRYGNCKRLEELACKMDLAVSAGSDFHGSRRVDRHLGKTCNDEPIKDVYLENLIKVGLHVEE